MQGQVDGTAASSAHFVMGLLYVMVPLGFIGGVRARWGPSGVLVLLAVCKSTDIGAYYAGKSLGGPKLAPVVSPRKTWAGVGGAVVAACGTSLLLSAVGYSGLGGGASLVYGVLMAGGAVVADLAESALKREARVKDSGDLLPGSGGLLDMADDILFAAPFTYVFFALAHG
jgi:phosphatidate cytidylyltransferase